MQTFKLPPDDDCTDGAPKSIDHRVDYMFEDTDKLMFHDNYLCYSWETADSPITARAYLDEIAEVSPCSDGLTLAQLTTPVFEPTLRYLQRHYKIIKIFDAQGTYQVAYQLAAT